MHVFAHQWNSTSDRGSSPLGPWSGGHPGEPLLEGHHVLHRRILVHMLRYGCGAGRLPVAVASADRHSLSRAPGRRPDLRAATPCGAGVLQVVRRQLRCLSCPACPGGPRARSQHFGHTSGLCWTAFVAATKTPRDTSRNVLGDANAQMGSVMPEAVGGHAAERQSAAGEMFHQVLLAPSLWLPSTLRLSADLPAPRPGRPLARAGHVGLTTSPCP
jgi:hypothetical protein